MVLTRPANPASWASAALGRLITPKLSPRIRGISSAGLCQGWATVPPNPSHAHQLRWFLPGLATVPANSSITKHHVQRWFLPNLGDHDIRRESHEHQATTRAWATTPTKPAQLVLASVNYSAHPSIMSISSWSFGATMSLNSSIMSISCPGSCQAWFTTPP